MTERAARAARAGGLLAVLALSVAGCGGGQDDSGPGLGAPVAPPPVTAPAVTDTAALQAALLTPAEVPPGYSPLDAGAPDRGQSAPDHSRTDPAECSKVLATVGDQSPGSSAHAAVSYSTPDFAGIDIDAASYPGNGAAQAFTAVQQLLHRCTAYSGTDADGIAIDYRVSGLEQPQAGDASTAFAVQTTSEGMSLYSAASLAVVGSTVVQVVETAPQPIDPATLRDLTARQVQRLRDTPAH